MLNTWKKHLQTVRSTLTSICMSWSWSVTSPDVYMLRKTIVEGDLPYLIGIFLELEVRTLLSGWVKESIYGILVWQQASGLDRSKSSKHTKVTFGDYSFSLVTYLLTVHLICTSVVFFCKSLVKPSSSIVSGCHWSGPSTSSTKMPCDDEWTLYLESVCVAGRRDSMKAAGPPAGGGILPSCCAAPTSVDRRRVCEQLHNCGAFLSVSIDPTVIISPELKGNTHTLKIG